MRWPGLFDGVDSATEDWIVDQMHTVNNLEADFEFSLSCYGFYANRLWFSYVVGFVI